MNCLVIMEEVTHQQLDPDRAVVGMLLTECWHVYIYTVSAGQDTITPAVKDGIAGFLHQNHTQIWLGILLLVVTVFAYKKIMAMIPKKKTEYKIGMLYGIAHLVLCCLRHSRSQTKRRA